MTKTLGVLGTLVACVSFVFASQDAPDAAKKKDATIRALIAATNADKLGTQMIDQMGTAIEGSVGAAFWKKFRAKVHDGDLVELIVPIYAKHFTQEELDQLVAFYQSPIGKKLVEKQPLIVKDSVAAGMEWGKKIATEAMEEFEKSEKKDGK